MFSITNNMFFSFWEFIWVHVDNTNSHICCPCPVYPCETWIYRHVGYFTGIEYIYNIYRDLNMYGYRMCVYIYTYIHTCSHMCPRIVLAVGLCSPIYSYLLHTTTKKLRKPKHQPPLHVTSSTRNKCLNNSIVWISKFAWQAFDNYLITLMGQWDFPIYGNREYPWGFNQ